VIIGIDASRAFVAERTGIEEYSYQIIKNLTDKLNDRQVVLYLKKGQTVDFDLPKNWKIKIIEWPYLWTQVGLSLEMLFRPVDTLFVPAHTVPVVHPASPAGGPKNTIVTIHGLEYEFCPEAYSFWAKLYMRWSIKKSCRWAKKIIAVSENTKRDLIKLYKVPESKIEVIYEGMSENFKFQISNDIIKIINTKYILFIGRLEERKNIIGIIRAFEILKEYYKIPHKLILLGKFGYGEEKIRREIKNVNCVKDIILTGFVSEKEKWEILKNAAVFLFPTFYEGFGLPILEAQNAGVPVIAGNNSSIPEIVSCHSERNEESRANNSQDDNLSAVLVNPKNAEEIADAAYKIICDENFRNGIIEKGYENIKRFSWEKCAKKIADLLM
jgi:glycosyltransferase involved in cell wall biosynthesis